MKKGQFQSVNAMIVSEEIEVLSTMEMNSLRGGDNDNRDNTDDLDRFDFDTLY